MVEPRFGAASGPTRGLTTLNQTQPHLEQARPERERKPDHDIRPDDRSHSTSPRKGRRDLNTRHLHHPLSIDTLCIFWNGTDKTRLVFRIRKTIKVKRVDKRRDDAGRDEISSFRTQSLDALLKFLVGLP